MSTSSAVSSRTESGRWDRQAVAMVLSQYLRESAEGTSQRAFADKEGVPRSTLQDWDKRRQQLDLPPEAVAFFESPAGVVFLHKLVVALHLVINWVGSGGIRLICKVLELCGLDEVVAASYGVHQGTARQMQQALVGFGEEERSRLAEDMPHREITVVEDETFQSSGICLVAIEPVAGFILAEEYAEDRTSETWNATLDAATEGLDVAVIQSTADEARALARHAKDQGAHHSPDLFHVDHEINKAMAFALARRERDAVDAVGQARQVVEHHRQARDAYWSGPRGPGRPPNFDKRIDRAKQELAERVAARKQATRHREEYLAAVRDLGRLYHPYDLKTGQPRSPEDLAASLEGRFATLQRVAQEAGLSTRAISKINKAERMVPKMVDTVRFFHDTVQQRIEALELPPHHEALLRDRLIPAAYLFRVIGRQRDVEKKEALTETVQGLLQDPAVSALTSDEATMLEQAALDCADVFQRASSCVEGRNGRLSQWEHAQRRLRPDKLAGLTVVHNYFIQRPDGTTAAERFFGAKPRDLFEYLLESIPLPSRPAASRKNPQPRRLLHAA